MGKFHFERGFLFFMYRKSFALLFLSAALILSCVTTCFGSALPAAKQSLPVTDPRDKINLPVLMYHGITDSPSEVNEYNITIEDFESDLKWLGENGFTTVLPSQLIEYVQNGSPLPTKPVLLTFDDGYANNYNLAYPLLQKYHMKALISIIGSQSDLSSGDIYRDLFNSNLSWGEIAIMAYSGKIEIGNHTYDLHSSSGSRKGADKISGESFEDYRQALSEDLAKNNKKIDSATGKAPVVFAWPYGAYPKDGSGNTILKELGFKMSLTSYQKMNVIQKGNPDSIYGLKRFLRTPDFDMSTIIW